jgi:translation initiation factor IF-3
MIQHKSAGEVLLLKLSVALEEYGRVEQLPKLEGFKMTMVVIPHKKK